MVLCLMIMHGTFNFSHGMEKTGERGEIWVKQTKDHGKGCNKILLIVFFCGIMPLITAYISF